MNLEEFYKEFSNIYEPIKNFEDNSLPLCAAETIVSDFVRAPLSSFIQERYLLGGVMEYSQNNFIGSDNIYEIYNLLNELCTELFHCSYADGRTLTGVNTILTLLMSLFENGDTIYISSPEYGGHSSMPKICKRLGITTIDLPYNIKEMDFDYDEINIMLEHSKVNGILISLSDMIFQPDLSKLKLQQNTTLIYDATQVLGLIATQQIVNYFDVFPSDFPFILCGSTHKTLPGPTNGIVMTNSKKIMKALDLKINPDYLRSVQLHQVLSSIFCLEEFSLHGKSYMSQLVHNANTFANYLKIKGFDVISRNNIYSTTHQIFIHLPNEIVDSFYSECKLYNITLNKRYSQLYKGSGIRLGLQKVTRYGWAEQELKMVADILWDVYLDCTKPNHPNYHDISNKIKFLCQFKELKYTINDDRYLCLFQ